MPVIIREINGLDGSPIKVTVDGYGMMTAECEYWIGAVVFCEEDWSPETLEKFRSIMDEWRALAAKESANYNSLQFTRRQREESVAAIDRRSRDATINYCAKATVGNMPWFPYMPRPYTTTSPETQWHEWGTPIIPVREVIVRNRVGVYAIMRTCPVGCMWVDIPK
jgi:hypothetical protein